MSDPTALKEEDPSDTLIIREDIPNNDAGTLNPQLATLQMASGLGDAAAVSKHSSSRERKKSKSETGDLGNDIGNAKRQDEIIQASKRDEDEGSLQTGRTTRPVLLSEMNLSPKKRKLILHIDLNNTILVSDAVTNQDPRAALNCYLSTVTWGKIGPKGDWQWLSESPSLLPPCQGAVSFYSQYGRNTQFTDLPLGRRFQDLHQRHLKLLEWQGPPHPRLSIEGEHGKHYHLVLPSFFYLLQSLHREGREFAVIFRTFGTDLPRVLQAVCCALEGQHSQFPALRDLRFPVNLNPGTIRCSKRKVVLTQGGERLSTEHDHRKVYLYFSSREGLCGFQDHFDWWAKNKFSIHGGKPLWIDPYDTDVHHICIDDNIRLNDSDSIIHPQVFSGQGSNCVRTTPTSELYDVCLVQTDLLEAIADVTYFCHCISRCEVNYENYLNRTCPATSETA